MVRRDGGDSGSPEAVAPLWGSDLERALKLATEGGGSSGASKYASLFLDARLVMAPPVAFWCPSLWPAAPLRHTTFMCRCVASPSVERRVPLGPSMAVAPSAAHTPKSRLLSSRFRRTGPPRNGRPCLAACLKGNGYCESINGAYVGCVLFIWTPPLCRNMPKRVVLFACLVFFVLSRRLKGQAKTNALWSR